MKKLFALLLVALFAVGTPFAVLASCGNCGKIKSIEPYNTHRSSTGGAVAGAVVGGLLGNQVGKGDGKKVATVAGAVGGAYVGKEIAKNSQKTRYRITIRMDDGGLETVDQGSINNLHVGNYVRIRDGRAVRL